MRTIYEDLVAKATQTRDRAEAYRTRRPAYTATQLEQLRNGIDEVLAHLQRLQPIVAMAENAKEIHSLSLRARTSLGLADHNLALQALWDAMDGATEFHYSLDDEPLDDLNDLVKDNAHDPGVIDEINAAIERVHGRPGVEYVLGGGAAAKMTLRCEGIRKADTP